MIQRKAWIVVVVALIFGFGAGFALRPIFIAPNAQMAITTPPLQQKTAEPRGKPYLAAHLEEAAKSLPAARMDLSGATNASTRNRSSSKRKVGTASSASS